MVGTSDFDLSVVATPARPPGSSTLLDTPSHAADKPRSVTSLPLSRIKGIMKADSDVNAIATDSIIAVTKATVRYVCWSFLQP